MQLEQPGRLELALEHLQQLAEGLGQQEPPGLPELAPERLELQAQELELQVLEQQAERLRLAELLFRVPERLELAV